MTAPTTGSFRAVLVVDGVDQESWLVQAAGVPALRSVDLMARLLLVARRRGGTLRLDGAADELWTLLDLAGLAELLRRGTSEATT